MQHTKLKQKAELNTLMMKGLDDLCNLMIDCTTADGGYAEAAALVVDEACRMAADTDECLYVRLRNNPANCLIYLEEYHQEQLRQLFRIAKQELLERSRCK